MKQTIASLALVCLCAANAEAGMQSLNSIEAAVTSYITQQYERAGDVEYRISHLDPRLRLPACGTGLQVNKASGSHNGDTLSLEVRCDSEKPWRLTVPVVVTRYAEVVVAVNAIERGAVVSQADVQLERQRIPAGRSGFYTDVKSVVGRVTRQSITGGQAILARNTRAQTLVHRGQGVVLHTALGNITVRARGKALQDGAAGERIRILNLSSERVVSGVVDGSGEVIVPRQTML